MTIAESIQLNKEQIAHAFGVPAHILADPDRTAVPRYWSLYMTSENHGTVGKAGDPFSHAPGKHERVLVVEVPAAPGAGSTAHPNWLDYDPAKDILTIYGVKYSGELFSGLGLGPVGMSFTILARKDGALTLCRGPVAAQTGHVAVPEGWKLVPVEPTLDMVTSGFESAPDEFFSPTEEWEAYAEMTGCQKAAHRARLCYAAMLAATPAALGNSPEIPDGSFTDEGTSAPDTPDEPQTAAARDVLAERQRQVSIKDWTPEHDDAHPCGEIAAFAALYAMPGAARDWPATETGYGDTFGAALCPEDWQPKFGDRRRELVKAGALVLAEIERLDRATTPKGGA